MTERSEMRARAAALVVAEKRHTEMMVQIAKRGGKTLDQVRALGPAEKDAFIFDHRSPKP